MSIKYRIFKDNRIRLLIFMLVLLLIASLGPLKEQNLVPLDGSYLYENNTPIPPYTSEPDAPQKEAVKFSKMEIDINGTPQVLFFLELDLSNPDLELFPVLSKDSVFGFEFLSEINQRYDATAVVNAGFNYSYGQPSGLVIQNGSIISGSLGSGRILLMDNKKAWFEDSQVKVWLDIEGNQVNTGWSENLQFSVEPELIEQLPGEPGNQVNTGWSENRKFSVEPELIEQLPGESGNQVNTGWSENRQFSVKSELIEQLSGESGKKELLSNDSVEGTQQDALQAQIRLPVDRVNPYPSEKGILVFTPDFGYANRVEDRAATCVIKNGRVVFTSVTEDETEIPKEGFLIVDLRAEDSPLLQLSPGQQINLSWDSNAAQGYQCSGTLVQNGINMAKDKDPWGGDLRIRTPRTAVGIKDKHTLVFLVVDGRQPGYSIGVTGKQLADILISAGVVEAALLDGGASSEMIVENEIVSHPSTGKERLLASAFVVRWPREQGEGSPVPVP